MYPPLDDVNVSVTFTCEVCGTVNVFTLPRTLSVHPAEKRCQGPKCKAVYCIYGIQPTVIRSR